MDAQQALAIMDVMAQKIEALTERIAVMDKKLNEQCSCKKWANDLRPGLAIFEPCTFGDDLTQEQVDDLLVGGISEIMPQG